MRRAGDAFIDTGIAPEFFADDLRLQPMGPVTRFTLLTTKQDSTGEHQEAVFSFIYPNNKIGLAIERTVMALGPKILMPLNYGLTRILHLS